MSFYKIIYTGLPTKFQTGYSLKNLSSYDNGYLLLISVYEEALDNNHFFLLDSEKKYETLATFSISNIKYSNFLKENIEGTFNFGWFVENKLSSQFNNDCLNTIFDEENPFYSVLSKHNSFYSTGNKNIIKYAFDSLLLNFIKDSISEDMLNEIKFLFFKNKIIENFDLNFLNSYLSGNISDDEIIKENYFVDNCIISFTEFKTKPDNIFYYTVDEERNFYFTLFTSVSCNVTISYNDSVIFSDKLYFVIQNNMTFDNEYKLIYDQINIVWFLSLLFSKYYKLSGSRYQTIAEKKLGDILITVNNEKFEPYLISSISFILPYNIDSYYSVSYSSNIKSIDKFNFDNYLLFKFSIVKNSKKSYYILNKYSENKKDIFLFYDEFDEFINLSLWDVNTNNIETIYGNLHLTNTSDVFISKDGFSGAIEITSKFYVEELPPNGFMVNGFYNTSSDCLGILIHPEFPRGYYIRVNGNWYGRYYFDSGYNYPTYTSIKSINGNTIVELYNRNKIKKHTYSKTLNGHKIRICERYDNLYSGQVFSAFIEYLYAIKIPDVSITYKINKINDYVYRIDLENIYDVDITDCVFKLYVNNFNFNGFTVTDNDNVISKVSIEKNKKVTNLIFNETIKTNFLEITSIKDYFKFIILLPKYVAVSPIPIDKNYKLDFSIPIAIVNE